MKKWLSNKFNANGTNLHYYRTGGEKTPIVLLHGITDDGLCWTAVADELSAEYDVIMLDLRGHGRSDAPDDGYDFKTMAGEVAALIAGLQLDQPVVMGHSLGAMTCLSLAAYYPDLVKTLILEDPPPFWTRQPPSDEELAFRDGMRSHLRDLKRKTYDELLAITRAENPAWLEVDFRPWIDSKHRFSLKIVRLIDPQKTVPADFAAKLGNVRCPTLLFTADPSRGAILTDKDVSELQRLIPQMQREHIPAAGHNIHRDQYSRFMSAVRRVLENTESRFSYP